MKYYLYYIYYRLYQAAEQREKNIPTVIAVGLMTIIIFLNLVTVLSLITIFTGIDAGYLLSVHRSDYAILAWFSVWGLVVWLCLRFFHVHEKAFSTKMVKHYGEAGFKGWWVLAYCLISVVATAWTAWLAGKQLRMH